MKRFVFIGLFLLLALAACHSPQREARQMVRRAERLFDTMPDSTARLIDSVLRMPVYFGEKQRMDMALLQAEALFGDRGRNLSPLMDDEFFDDKERLTTSPELERAAAYYARKKQYDKAAHAALYSGFVQQHYGEKAAAMQSFKDAEHYGGKAGDSLTVAMVQYKMGKLLYDDGMEQEALAILEISKRNFGSRFFEKALVQNTIAVCRLVLGDYENVEACLQQSLMYAEKGQNDGARRKVLSNYAVWYRLQGKYNQALDCLRRAKDCTDSSKLFLNYLNMGKVFAASSQWDSAFYYYQKIERILPTADVNNETKASAFEALSQFAENHHHDSLALKYRKTHESLLYEVMHQRQEQSIYRIQQQYDYESLQNLSNRKIILRHRIILIISILLFITASVILVLQHRHKQMLESEKEMKQQIDNLKKELSQSVKPSYLEQELASRIRLIISVKRTQQKAYDPKKEWNPMVIQLMNGKETVFEAIVEEIEKAYPNLHTVLCQKYPDLNETETKVCLLSCSDLSNKEIADILGISKHTVDKNRSKLRDKLNLTPERMKEQLRKVLSN